MFVGNYSERLKELRIEKGLTQAAVANGTGFRQNTIAQWEAGIRVPNANSIIALAEFFGVTADYLLGIED